MTTPNDFKFLFAHEGLYLVQLRDEAHTLIGDVVRDGAAWKPVPLDGSQSNVSFGTRKAAAERLLRKYELANGLRDLQGRHVARELETNLWFVADHSGRRISSRWVDKAEAIAKLASLQPTDWEAVGRQAALDDQPAAPSANADVRYALAGRPVGDPENVRIMEAFSKGYRAVRDEQADEVLSDARKAADQAIDTQGCMDMLGHLRSSRHTAAECPVEQAEKAAEQTTTDAQPEVLTIAAVTSLSDIIEAAIHGSKVARVLPKTGNVVVGTARSISDFNGNRLDSKTDVREAYLRVTTLSGTEVFWSVMELIPLQQSGEFVTRYQEA